MKNLLITLIFLLCSFSFYGQDYTSKTNMAEDFMASELAGDIARIANQKLIWHNFNNYKKDDHMHQYYILKENEDEDFLFFTPQYDCAGCLHIEFKPIKRELILYRIAGNYDYINKIWISYFHASKKSNTITKFSNKYKFYKYKYVWVIEKI